MDDFEKDLIERLTALEVKLDLLTTRWADIMNDLEIRARKLEYKEHYRKGVLAVIAVISSMVGAVLTQIMRLIE